MQLMRRMQSKLYFKKLTFVTRFFFIFWFCIVFKNTRVGSGEFSRVLIGLEVKHHMKRIYLYTQGSTFILRVFTNREQTCSWQGKVAV